MVINTNLSALNAATLLMQSQSKLSTSLQRLSSGSKITSPADDSAGLAVSMKLTAQMARIDAASNNVNNAVSFSQTQDGYVQQVNSAFSRMSRTVGPRPGRHQDHGDRALYQQEFQALGSYINNVSTKDFNGVSLFNGATLECHHRQRSQHLRHGGHQPGQHDLHHRHGGQHHVHQPALKALTDVKAAISQLASDRANIGSNEESLSYYGNQLSTLKNNLSAANSQITDVDVATESTNYAKENILVQTGTAMLAQANSLPQSVLKLLS